MPTIYSLPDDCRVEATDGETILTASLRADIPHAHACGGKARCSTCRVLVLDGIEMCGPRTSPEQELAEQLHFSDNVRLACQTTVHGDLSIRRPVVVNANQTPQFSDVRQAGHDGGDFLFVRRR